MPLTFARISNLLQLCTLFSILAAGLGIYLFFNAIISHYHNKNLELQAQTINKTISDRINHQQKQLKLLAKQPAILSTLSATDEARRRQEQRLRAEIPYALRVRLLKSGALKIDTRTVPHLSYACIDMLQAIGKNRVTTMAELHLQETPSAHIAMSVPLTNRNNSLTGYIHLSLSPDLIRDAITHYGDNNRYFELRQYLDKNKFIVMATHGKNTKSNVALKEFAAVPNTQWRIALAHGDTQWMIPENYWLIITLLGLSLVIFLLGPYFVNSFVQKTVQQDIKTLIHMVSDIRAGKLKKSYPTKMQEFSLIALQLRRSGGKLAKDMRALLESSQSDPLTGIATEKTFNTRVDQIFDQCRLGFPSSVLLIDIDRMAEINDTYGHEQGDKFLQTFVAELRTQMRQVDFIGRVSGSRFGILFPLTPLEAIQPAMKRLKKIQPFNMPLSKGVTHEINWSGGLSGMAPTDKSSTDVIVRAGAALAEAKQAGGGQTCTITA